MEEHIAGEDDCLFLLIHHWLHRGRAGGRSLCATSCWAGSSGLVEQGSRRLQQHKHLTPTLLPHPPTRQRSPLLRKFGGKYLASDSMGSTAGQAYS